MRSKSPPGEAGITDVDNKYIDINCVQFEKVYESICSHFGKLIVVKAEQFQKVPCPLIFIHSGKFIELNKKQL